MNWNQILSTKRFGMEQSPWQHKDDRTEFQRDYDRLVFSAPFRRMQNKTQVFPLPKTIFVHNRLTHSLEVSCVGRSLGCIAAQHLQLNANEVGNIVSAACLAHDMGNPPFGHSGETAIATFFSEGKGGKYRQLLDNEAQWNDFTFFDGNANAFRLLTHQFNGRRKGGFALTYSTLASIVKYPYPSTETDEKKHKFGFFSSEQSDYEHIADILGINRPPDNPNRFVRHPLVFLVEAADDICYQLMDIEDAFKLKIFSLEETKQLLLNFFDGQQAERRQEVLRLVADPNEQIAYLRSSVIGKLVNECIEVFVNQSDTMLKGEYDCPLIKNISPMCVNAYKACSEMAFKRIYRSHEVVNVEISGYKIITTLLEHLTEAVLSQQKAYSKQLLSCIPEQYETNAPTYYAKIQSVVDYISGMTDIYALDLYQKITGINIPML